MGGAAMTMTLIAVFGGFGALARYELGGWVQRRVDRPHPWGTLAVNVTGAFLTGLAHGATGMTPHVSRVVSSGFLGGFTTFSTWMVETVRTGEEGGRAGLSAAGFNVVSMIVGGLIGVIAGTWVAELTR